VPNSYLDFIPHLSVFYMCLPPDCIDCQHLGSATTVTFFISSLLGVKESERRTGQLQSSLHLSVTQRFWAKMHK